MNILSNTTLPTPRVAQGTFTDADWAEVLGHLADVIGPEAHRYATVPAAKLVAAIAYLAGSEDADRFAVSNLLTFHGATKARRLFNHRAADDEDIFRRLAAFHVGKQADPKVVDYGLNLLALISLGDHEHDQAADIANGKYNPVAAGKWNVNAFRKSLLETLEADIAMYNRMRTVVDHRTVKMGIWQ